MDYSKMSDFEINSAVHNAVTGGDYNLTFLGEDKIMWSRDDWSVITEKVRYGASTLRDYCNSPDDAWPIILSAGISIIQDAYEDECCAMTGAHTDLGLQITADLYSYDKNPLRAAMVVYLMSKEYK